MPSQKNATVWADVEEIRRAIRILFEPSQVVELRAIEGKRVVSGYFDDHEKLAPSAHNLARSLLDRSARQTGGGRARL